MRIAKDVQTVNKDIKNLANTFGLKYEVENTPDEIIFAISEEIEAQIDESEDNPQELSVLMSYMHKLNTLNSILNEMNDIEDLFHHTNMFSVSRMQKI